MPSTSTWTRSSCGSAKGMMPARPRYSSAMSTQVVTLCSSCLHQLGRVSVKMRMVCRPLPKLQGSCFRAMPAAVAA